ncbi:hypothetical protein [endosymbiont GvMRE of Glomus versiforme]|uniref:hypothetical protein n=1 Tax=endosymbiont GvMRE of Glomus versiforme TaxID=2039283 RepID=UPI000EE340AA|nr:hypothetical protein [endosymbiont GvMRE of Glomus versiforme]RHZ35618.1 hypothetical protein GvMRE_IIg394 [endosymbiont GvMRE of Glomus versiforme]
MIMEDFVKTIEVAEKKLEQESTTSTSSPDLTAEEKQKTVKKLTTDKAQLKTQKEKLENQTSTNDLDKTLQDQLLAENAREIAERDKEIARLLEKPSPTKQEGGNKLVYREISLGVVAVLIGIICLILLTGRGEKKNERRQQRY